MQWDPSCGLCSAKPQRLTLDLNDISRNAGIVLAWLRGAALMTPFSSLPALNCEENVATQHAIFKWLSSPRVTKGSLQGFGTATEMHTGYL